MAAATAALVLAAGTAGAQQAPTGAASRTGPLQLDSLARQFAEQGSPVLGQYWQMRESLDPDADLVIRQYVGGLSDGIYAHEQVMRKATGGTRFLCFGSPVERRPTREQAILILDNFSQVLQASQTPREELEAFPLLTVMQIAYQQAWPCSAAAQAPQ